MRENEKMGTQQTPHQVVRVAASAVFPRLAAGLAVGLAALLSSAQVHSQARVEAKSSTAGPGPAVWQGDLSPIRAADWSQDRAAHLLERAGFGGTLEEIDNLAAMTPQQAVRRLVRYQEVENIDFAPFDESGFYPHPNFIYKGRGQAIREALQTGSSIGVTIKQDGPMRLQPVVTEEFYYRFSAFQEMFRAESWLAARMLTTRRPLQEKLALFWHGHFATGNEKVRDYRKMLWQYDLLRQNANGNFRDLLIGISKDPAMLIYLDNRQNVKGHPNENYAREVLELFSMGVGNYTETDIREAARAFTGWTDDGLKFRERPDQHDSGEKTFLGRKGNFDGAEIIDIILEQNAPAHFIARKLYRFFVREELSPELENTLAAALRDGKYEIAPFLEMMFLSRDFYSPKSYATQIKSPIHLVVSTYRKLGLASIPGTPDFRTITRDLGQEVGHPPNVKGWDGGRTWINPSTLLERQNFARYLLFPEKAPALPPLAERRAAFVQGIVGKESYDQMVEMARRGDYESPPRPSTEGSKGSELNMEAMNTYGKEEYNLYRGVFNAGMRLFDRLKVDPATPADLNLVRLLQSTKAKDTSAAVDHFARRFLRVPLHAAKRDALVGFLQQRLGGQHIDFANSMLETHLRELLHLILSAPEYQVA